VRKCIRLVALGVEDRSVDGKASADRILETLSMFFVHQAKDSVSN
jgi:hypothetical protein